MIRYTDGSLFDSGAQCLINPVNTVGVMGAGLAKAFRTRYPDMFATYRKMCEEGDLRPGQVAFWAAKREPEQVICLFPTKEHFSQKSTVLLIDASLRSFAKFAPYMNIETAAFPMVGCGLGGLDFDLQVKPLLERHLKALQMDVAVYVNR
jgi:O-acetyl-ADP-ribose deacetylase (regulator of RNase III)